MHAAGMPNGNDTGPLHPRAVPPGFAKADFTQPSTSKPVPTSVLPTHSVVCSLCVGDDSKQLPSSNQQDTPCECRRWRMLSRWSRRRRAMLEPGRCEPAGAPMSCSRSGMRARRQRLRVATASLPCAASLLAGLVPSQNRDAEGQCGGSSCSILELFLSTTLHGNAGCPCRAYDGRL